MSHFLAFHSIFHIEFKISHANYHIYITYITCLISHNTRQIAHVIFLILHVTYHIKFCWEVRLSQSDFLELRNFDKTLCNFLDKRIYFFFSWHVFEVLIEHPISDTRISVCPFVMLRPTPLDSEMEWTGEFWSKQRPISSIGKTTGKALCALFSANKI